MEKYILYVEKKNGKKYEVINTFTDKEFVMESFIGTMRQKFLYGSKNIFRVESRTNYDGTMTAKFSMMNGYRYTYIIPDR